MFNAADDVAFVAFVHWSVTRGSVPFMGPNRSGGSVSVVLVDSCDSSAGGFCTSCAETTEKLRIVSLTAIRKDILDVIKQACKVIEWGSLQKYMWDVWGPHARINRLYESERGSGSRSHICPDGSRVLTYYLT